MEAGAPVAPGVHGAGRLPLHPLWGAALAVEQLGKRALGPPLLTEVNLESLLSQPSFLFCLLVAWPGDTYSLLVRHPVELYLYLLRLTVVTGCEQ